MPRSILSLYSIETHQQLAAFRNERFPLLPQCFLLNQIIVSPLVYIFVVISLSAAEFEEPKTGTSGKGLSIWFIEFRTVV